MAKHDLHDQLQIQFMQTNVALNLAARWWSGASFVSQSRVEQWDLPHHDGGHRLFLARLFGLLVNPAVAEPP